MKKQFFRIGALACLMMLLTACPYQSKVPISEPSEKVNKKLFGQWMNAADLEVENPTYYEIGKFSKIKYDVKEYTYSSYDSVYTMKQYWMHESVLGDKTFMNLQSASSDEGYYLYKIEVGDNEFTLFEVTDNIDEQFATSEELRKFVEKHMNLSFFYSKSEVKYIKKPK